MTQVGWTTRKLSKPSPIGDGMLQNNVISRDDMERMARHMRRTKHDDEAFILDLEIAVERDIHVDLARHFELEWKLHPGQRWPKYPRDPIKFPDGLPSIVMEDEDFNPMCVWCRKRYDL